MEQVLILAAEGGGNGFILGHDIKEVVVSGIASLILFAILYKFGKEPLRKAWTGRISQIETELADAEAARTEANRALADVQSRVANFEQERQRILAEARETAEAVRQQVIERAEADAAALRERGAIDAQSSKHQALADVHDQVAALAVEAAEVVVRNNLDDATQHDLIERYIQQVGAGS